jgi:hypothetical protein
MSSKVRNTKIEVKYKNSRTKKTYSLSSEVSSFRYIDCATGEGDTVEITFDNKNKQFLGKYYPGKKDMMKCKIDQNNYSGSKSKKVNCESFHVDTLSFDGLTKCTIGGISVPRNSTFAKTTRSKTWKKVTLEAIAKQIAKRAGVKLYYSAKKISIKKIEQSDETDCSFLYSLCQTYGVAMKIYSNRLIIFDEADYEKKKSIATFKPTTIVEDSLDAEIELIRTYTGYKFTIETKQSTTTSKKKKTVKTTYWEKFITSPLIYTNIGTCDDKTEGTLKGRAKVNEANKNMQLVTFEVMGNPRLIATACIRLKNFGKLNGKYYINKVTHNYDCDSGYTCTIEARKIQQRLKGKK